jgi:hypothetical protein
MAATALPPSSLAQNGASEDEKYYVVDTKPPNAFLALRANLTSGSGQRIATMPNGTPLKGLDRRGDGWARSRQGNSVRIEWGNRLRTIPTPDEPTGFRTPSNNIYCQIDESVLRCDLRQASGVKPPRPRDCDLEWGDAFIIEQNGLSGYPLCHADTVANDALPILSYGSIWEREGYTCKSEEAGLTCLNGMGHGFSLSRSSQRVF